MLLIAVWVAGCQPGQLPPFIPVMQTPMLVPTFTPTPPAALASPSQDISMIDAEGLDFVEQRIIHV